MSVIIDEETGLHAEDCPCLPCQTGYGPTSRERERQREIVRRAVAVKVAREQAAAKAAAPKRPGWVSRYMPHVQDHRPYTAEEIAELDRMRRDFRR